MKTYLKLTLLIFFAIFFSFSSSLNKVFAQSPKKILILYKERDPSHEGVVNYLTTFLKESGYTWEAKDIEKLLPERDKLDLSSFQGILTCYLSSEMVGGDIYPLWLVSQMEKGKKIVIVGSYGAYQALIPKPNGKFIRWNESTQTINTFFWPFGLEFYFGWTNDPQKLKITKKEKEFSEFQANLPDKLNYYQLYKSINKNNKVYLEANRIDMLEAKSALIAHTPFGGMILEGFGFFWDDKEKKIIQRVNFKKFFQIAFSGDTPKVPVYNVKSHDQLLGENLLPGVFPPKWEWLADKDEVKRKILVLYKENEARTVEDHPLYHRGEIALNYLGAILDYHPIESGLPDEKMMQNYKGIITWNTTPFMFNADKYGRWLYNQINSGRKLVIIQDYGALYDLPTQIESGISKKIFEALGIEYKKLPPSRIEYLPILKKLDKTMLGFEAYFDPDSIYYSSKFTSKLKENKVFLSFKDYYAGDIDLVVITPKGAIAMENSAFYFPPGDPERIALIRKALKKEIKPELAEEKTLGGWLINPYLFFDESLSLKDIPAPDVTTLNGTRIFYAHIDGDGLESISLIDKAHFAGKFILDEILKEYKEIPTSISFITRPIEKYGNKYYKPTLELAREILELPNCETASHTSTHPFDWVGGDPYVMNPSEYPYRIGYKPQNFVDEIWGSKLFLDFNLAPAEKKCKTLFWSGACNPDDRALEVAWRAGLHNINGGDPIFDSKHPSIAGLSPLATKAGIFRQYHTSAQNDYIYTLFLTGDWGGQKNLLDHFEKTENPRRILPMNLYYHFYSGIKRESLEALKIIYNYIRENNFATIFTSEYCQIVEDFYFTRLWNKNNIWWCENNGYLRTLRFKGKVNLDIAQSEGVVGYCHFQNQTYVHLDGSKKRKITLSLEPPSIPYIQLGSYFVDNMTTKKNFLTFKIKGFGKMYFQIAGFTPDKLYNLKIENEKKELIKEIQVKSNLEGLLNFKEVFNIPIKNYRISIKSLEN